MAYRLDRLSVVNPGELSRYRSDLQAAAVTGVKQTETAITALSILFSDLKGTTEAPPGI
jgi:predicted phosphodiesterase